ncbi:MAG: DNA-binding response regulator [Bacteroidales bacterium]|nr:MAG: DNA-binding response regulator [Bacteroidales bacterium]
MVRFDVIDKLVENHNQPEGLEVENTHVSSIYGLINEVLDNSSAPDKQAFIINTIVNFKQRKAILKKIKDKYARVCLFLVDEDGEIGEVDCSSSSRYFNSTSSEIDIRVNGNDSFSHNDLTIVLRFQPERTIKKLNGNTVLTNREKEILNLLSQGLLYKEIAKTMGISLQTVKSHLKHIYTKLRVSNRSEAIIKHLQFL